jgi:Flp pilus assembly protein TadD
MPDHFWSSEEYDEQAHLLYNEGDLDGALHLLKEGLTLYPNAVELLVGLGYARMGREEFAWARASFERALVLDPGHEEALVGMGEVLLRFGNQDTALRLFQSVEEMGFEDDVELMLTMGRALFREGLYGRALDTFTRLAAARPESAEAIVSIGYTLHQMGDEVGASRHLRRALRTAPDHHDARLYLGHILYERGDWPGALREFERVPMPEHWDSVATWRLIELRRSVHGWSRDDPRLDDWRAHLAVLEEWEDDPVDRLLSEVEASFGARPQWPLRDENQLELFRASDDAKHDPGVVAVRASGGEVFRGTWYEVVRQVRDAAGFTHESLASFMRRLAEEWHERYGIDVPLTDPESFLRGAVAAGVFQFARASPPRTDTPQEET